MKTDLEGQSPVVMRLPPRDQPRSTAVLPGSKEGKNFVTARKLKATGACTGEQLPDGDREVSPDGTFAGVRRREEVSRPGWERN